VWFAGLKALISSFQGSRSKIDGWGGGLNFDVIIYLNSAKFSLIILVF